MPETLEPNTTQTAGLDPHAAIRLEHAGRWVAWTEHFGRFVAAGDSREEAIAAARAAGIDHPACEWIPANLLKKAGSGE